MAQPTPAQSILSETRNLIRLYRHQVGRSEVPTEYHLWSVISLIAACVADRVYYRKFADARLFPNLYIMLIGASGIGKGTAINQALRYAVGLTQTSPYVGNITKQALIDELSYRQIKFKMSNLWFISPELGDDIPPGSLGEDLIRFLTKIYEGDMPLPIKEKTRTRGTREILNPCLNWLAGTTQEWLSLSLPKYAVEGGSMARIITVNGSYDSEIRLVRPIYPRDRDEVINELKRRVRELCFVSGEFSMDNLAAQLDEQWYMNRAAPTDELMMPTWKRQHDLVIKLAMILSLADGELDLIIKGEHIKRAQALAKSTMRFVPSVISMAALTSNKDADGLGRVAAVLRRHREVPRFMLMQRVSKYGVTKDKLTDIIGTLQQARQIEIERSEGGGVVYKWIEGVKKFALGGED